MGCHMNKLPVFKKKLVLADFLFRILGRGTKDGGCNQRERSLRPKEDGGVHRWDLEASRLLAGASNHGTSVVRSHRSPPCYFRDGSSGRRNTELRGWTGQVIW